MHQRNSKGFTIIELMAVVAIISILAVIALGAYSDYAARAQVSEGLGLASEVKTGVMQAYYLENVMPVNNDQAGVPAADSYLTDIVNSIGVGVTPTSGTITIHYSATLMGVDNKLQLIPALNASGTLEWTCKPAASNGIKTSRVPPACRN